MDKEAVVVACQQNQCRQNFNAPLLPSGQYCGHGVAIFAWSPKAPKSTLEALAEESIRNKEKAEKVYFYLRQNF
jgi:hypothetical protein